MPSRLYGRINSDRIKTERTAQGNYNMSAQVEDWDRKVVLEVRPNSHGENVVEVAAGAKDGTTNSLMSVNMSTGEVEVSPFFDRATQLLREVS